MWMIADEDFESITETLDVLAETAAMRDIAQFGCGRCGGDATLRRPNWS